MIIITDLLTIDHLISVFVTLPYLLLVFRHLNSLPYIISYLNKYNLLPIVVSKNNWMGGKQCRPWWETFKSHIWTSTIYYPLLCLKITGWVANSVDPDETPHLRIGRHIQLSHRGRHTQHWNLVVLRLVVEIASFNVVCCCSIAKGTTQVQQNQWSFCVDTYGLFSKALYHFENTPIQIYRKFHLQKLKIFR